MLTIMAVFMVLNTRCQISKRTFKNRMDLRAYFFLSEVSVIPFNVNSVIKPLLHVFCYVSFLGLL